MKCNKKGEGCKSVLSRFLPVKTKEKECGNRIKIGIKQNRIERQNLQAEVWN
jgi:hypothetical protein